MKRAYFAGGCFWCMTPQYREAGADRDVCVYYGGEVADPDYEDVKAQKTGHRETIMLEYDPAKVSYGQLLDIYFENVDPFDAGGQFIDRGHSYTLAVYWSSEEEKALAEERIRKLEEESGRTVCVALEPFARFYDAEEYHQDYELKNPEAFERELIESGRKSAGG